MRLAGEMDQEFDDQGRPIIGDTLLVLFNSHHDQIAFLMPPHEEVEFWQPLLDTTTDHPLKRLHSQQPYPLQAHSMAVLKLTRPRKKLLERGRDALRKFRSRFLNRDK